MVSNQAAIQAATRAMVDRTGNLPPLPGIFPDYPAPIVRSGPDGRELAMARWGMPSPRHALEGKRTDPGVTNIRNVASPHWRRWLGPENRCLVPFTSFSEHEALPNGRRLPVWFALGDDRPLAFFAGVHVRGWSSGRKLRGRGHGRPIRHPHDLAERRGRRRPPKGHARDPGGGT